MIVTFGHTTMDTATALRILDSGGVDVLIDVRSHPTSRFEQWRREKIAKWLPQLSGGAVQYQWWPELGGWDVRHADDAGLRQAMRTVGVDLAAYSSGAFPKQRIAKTVAGASDGPTWTNQGLLDYAWFTSLPEFNDGLDRLTTMFGDDDQPTAALMCCEAVWWRCHRSMIADVLVARGVGVHHLMPRWSSHESALGNRIERYPEAVRACWSGVSPEAALLTEGSS